MVTSTEWRKSSVSNCPFGPKNFNRLSDARLHAVSSRNIYSEHGLEALMRSVAFDVCQRLIVVSYCMPGSPHCHADSAMAFIMSRARYLSAGLPSLTLRVHQSRSSSTARMNSSVTRTEWLAFWKNTDV